MSKSRRIQVDAEHRSGYRVGMVQVRAGRARKRHVQQELFRHGGKRAGAGRPPKKGRRPSERHERRLAVRASQPGHVVIRAEAEVGSLRRRLA